MTTPDTASDPRRLTGDTKAYGHNCEVCHEPIPQKPGRGAIKRRHPDCKRFANTYAAMDRALMDLRDSGRLTYAHVRDIRSKLWRTANDLNVIGDDRGKR